MLRLEAGSSIAQNFAFAKNFDPAALKRPSYPALGWAAAAGRGKLPGTGDGALAGQTAGRRGSAHRPGLPKEATCSLTLCGAAASPSLRRC